MISPAPLLTSQTSTMPLTTPLPQRTQVTIEKQEQQQQERGRQFFQPF